MANRITPDETRMIRPSHLALILLITGCTGTDYIADPPMSMEEEPTASLTITPDMAAIEVGAPRR